MSNKYYDTYHVDGKGQPLNTFNKTGSNVEWKQEAERRWPLDNPRKVMMHDNMGQYSRRGAFIEGCQFAHSLDRQKAEQIWVACDSAVNECLNMLDGDFDHEKFDKLKETFLNEMFGDEKRKPSQE